MIDKERIRELEEKLRKVGICPKCMQEIRHHWDEPIADCGCPGGQGECITPPLIATLRFSLRALADSRGLQ